VNVAASLCSLGLLGLFLEAGRGGSGTFEICSPQSGTASVGKGKEDACDWDLLRIHD